MTSIGCKRSLVFVHYIYSRTIVNDSKWAEIESICWKSTRQTVHGKIFQLFGFHFFHDILTELAVFTVAVPLTSLLWTQRAELLSHDISVDPRNIKKNLFQFQQYFYLPHILPNYKYIKQFVLLNMLSYITCERIIYEEIFPTIDYC